MLNLRKGSTEQDLAGLFAVLDGQAAPGDLLIDDRGYPAFWLFALHLSVGVDFCMRLSQQLCPGPGLL
jgi:hypothetical protein